MCDAIQGNQSEVKYVTVLYLLELLIIRGTFCWKHHLNRTSGFKVSNWRILKTRENKRNPFFFLFSGPRSNNKCSRLPTDYARSQHIIWDNYKSEFLMHKMKSISCWKIYFENQFLNINVDKIASVKGTAEIFMFTFSSTQEPDASTNNLDVLLTEAKATSQSRRKLRGLNNRLQNWLETQ